MLQFLLNSTEYLPEHEGSLGVHEVKLVVQPRPGLHDGGGVGEAADGPVHLGQVPARHHSRGLVVDADLEASGAPVHKLDTSLGLDGGNGSVDILGHHVSPVKHAAGHVLAVAGVAFHHRVDWLETSVGDLSNGELLVVGLK